MLGTMSTLAEQLGAALSAVREACEVSQGDLGRRIGKKQTYISEWESGRKTLPLRLIPDIEDALGLAKGTILARAGLVDQLVSTRDVIASDPSLDPEDRRLLLGLYDRSRRRVDANNDGVADHP